MNQPKFTQRKCVADGLIVQTDDGLLSIAEVHDHSDTSTWHTTDEAKSNADLIVAAFNAATAAQDMGFDGIKAVEALPKLLKTLKQVEHRLTEVARAFFVSGKASDLKIAFNGWKEDIEPARSILAQIYSKKEPTEHCLCQYVGNLKVRECAYCQKEKQKPAFPRTGGLKPC